LLGPLDGAILSIKDLFDVAGEVTRAGSKVVVEEGKPAERMRPRPLTAARTHRTRARAPGGLFTGGLFR
jgi:hypothetical protein